MRQVSLLLFLQPAKVWHPSISLETLKLRRTNLLQDSSCYRDFSEAIGIPGLLDAIGLDAMEELVAIEEDIFIAAGRDLDTTLSSSF